MKRIFSLFLFLPLTIFAQTETQILSYDVSAIMNERSSTISGNVRFEARMADSSSAQFTFLVPKNWTLNSLRNWNNDAVDNDRSVSASSNFDLITLDLADMEQRGDTLFLNIEFNAAFDSSSSQNIFITQKEFFLPYNRSLSWLPQFGSLTAGRFSLEFTLPPQFTVVAEEPFDTVSTEGSRTWKRNASQPTLLTTAFTLCGLQNAMKQKAFSSDSLFSVTLFSSHFKFNQQYAAAITNQLSDAVRYFTAMTKQTRVKSVTYAVIGTGKIEKTLFSSTDFIVLRNSPAYTVFDSASITRTAFNHWLLQLSRRFCPASNDSTAVFDDGFASYLALRFLRSSYPSFTKQEQFQSLSNALTFFPVGTIAAGHTSKANTNEIISFKGRNLFLMLEQLLGSESFNAVIETMSVRYSETHITFNEFQILCEAEYGSSLEWFFNQWLHRSTAPEYVMQWKSETTPRGMSIIRTTIEQRGDLFSMPVPLVFTFGNRKVTKRVFVEQAKQEFTFTFPRVPVSVELDPQYTILRWLLNIRISAHAKTSLQFLSINRDVVNAEREALYTLQLDPNNSTGSAPLAYYVIGNISAAAGNSEKAKENFLKAASSFATEETDLYGLLSSIRYANLLENDGKREEAIALYQRAIAEGLKNPLILDRAIIEAENFIHEKFTPDNDIWFDIH